MGTSNTARRKGFGSASAGFDVNGSITPPSLTDSRHNRLRLRIQAELDTNIYPKGIKISDEELSRINTERDDFHGDWNYTVKPR